MSRIACVVIGRNEGQRLALCLESVLALCDQVVYVDSRSTDDSVAVARARGVETVVLDEDERLSAARGRNRGFEHVERRLPEVEYVQFLDGDSVLVPGWLEAGARELERHPQAAAACGRVREQHPRASIYNTLYEMDWVHEPGELEWFGGSAMFRVTPFRDVGGFDPTLIAGEDPDLYSRLRAAGHTIRSIAHDMVLHDADMTRFAEWWTRNVRTGHAYAEALRRRPTAPAMNSAEALQSIMFWGLWLPGLSLVLAPPTLGTSLIAALVGYSALFLRVYLSMRGKGFSPRDARLYAAFCAIGKVPQMWGVFRFRALALRGIASELIEYKGPA